MDGCLETRSGADVERQATWEWILFSLRVRARTCWRQPMTPRDAPAVGGFARLRHFLDFALDSSEPVGLGPGLGVRMTRNTIHLRIGSRRWEGGCG